MHTCAPTHTQLFSSSQVPTTKLHLEHLCKVFRVPYFLCFSTVICSVYALNRYYLINRYFIHITTMDLKKKARKLCLDKTVLGILTTIFLQKYLCT